MPRLNRMSSGEKLFFVWVGASSDAPETVNVKCTVTACNTILESLVVKPFRQIA